jgi:citrate lyase subunit beta/citryl-CoA lyase
VSPAPGRSLARARTLLFVPGGRPDRFASALAAPADLVVVDLEASVHPDRKEAARAALAALVADLEAARRIVVRVNLPGGPWFDADRVSLGRAASALAGVMLPMAGGADAVAAAVGALPAGVPVVALVETAAGILDAAAIARVPGVARLAFGNMDYETDTGSRGRDSKVVPSAALVLASRAARLPAPIAGVTAAYRDLERLADDARWERAQGFGAKLCIHPAQLDVAAAVFAPGDEEIAWARRVVAASRDNHAAVVDGELVDRPVIERAEAILRELDPPP